MGALYDALVSLSPAHDTELLDGYRRYENEIQSILTPTQVEEYAAWIRHAGEVRIFEELTPAELATLSPEEQRIAQAVLADLNVSMENRRVVALLNQRGEHAVAPDLHTTGARTYA